MSISSSCCHSSATASSHDDEDVADEEDDDDQSSSGSTTVTCTTAAATATTTPTFQVGDRVIVHSLLKASHLNGRHGCIGEEMDATTGRWGIDLDTWANRVMAKDVNLKPEPTTFVVAAKKKKTKKSRRDSRDDDDEENTNKDDDDGSISSGMVVEVDPLHVADVMDGVLVENEGRPLGLILDAIRFLVGSVLLHDPHIQRGLIDIEQLRQQGDAERIHMLMNMAWKHWQDAKPYYTPDNLNVYELTKQFFQDLPKANPDHQMPQEFCTALAALNHRTAVGGWNTARLEGEFWIVGCNEENGGTFLVANANRNLVFEVFGIRNSLYSRVEEEEPVLIKATLLPWYGRLVCDQAVKSAASESIPDEELEDELFTSVDLAREEGRVLEKLRELELPPNESDEDEDFQFCSQPPTLTESHYLRQMADMPISRPDEAIWCMRRRGYTEHDNPHHMGVIINGVGGIAIGPFSCSRLEPTCLDILQALVAYCGEDGKVLPAVLLIDEEKCFRRMKFLLKHFDISVQYYPPPTPEETEAALMNEQY